MILSTGLSKLKSTAVYPKQKQQFLKSAKHRSSNPGSLLITGSAHLKLYFSRAAFQIDEPVNKPNQYGSPDDIPNRNWNEVIDNKITPI